MWWFAFVGCSMWAEGSSGDVPIPSVEVPVSAPAGRPPARRDGERGRDPSRAAPGDGARGRAVAGLVQVTVDREDIGGERTAWVHVPEKRPAEVPVVLAFHGGKGRSGTDMAPNFEAVLGEPFLYVFPNGKALADGEPGWTGYGREAEGEDPLRDIRFVGALLDRLDEAYDIDRDRVYAAGFSNGGYMSWHLACLSPETLAGVAIVAKPFLAELESRCAMAKPVPLLYIQGTDDTRATWDGTASRTLSAPDTVARFSGLYGCRDRHDETLPDLGDQTIVTRSTWTCDRAGLEFYKIEGGGHFWPRKQPAGPPGLSRDLEASEAAIQFFRAHGG